MREPQVVQLKKEFVTRVELPRQAVSLLVLEW